MAAEEQALRERLTTRARRARPYEADAPPAVSDAGPNHRRKGRYTDQEGDELPGFFYGAIPEPE